MKNILIGISIILWILSIIIFIGAMIHGNLLSLAPVFAHNHPCGLFGWILFLAIIFTVASSIVKNYNK